MKHLISTTVIILCILGTVQAQSISERSWVPINSKEIYPSNNMMIRSLPHLYEAFEIDHEKMNVALSSVSTTSQKSQGGTRITLPTLANDFEEFEIFENQVIDPSVADQYTIKTFEGRSTIRPNVTIRCDISESGFHALIFDTDGMYIIEPLYNDRNDVHIAYAKDAMDIEKIACSLDHSSIRIDNQIATTRNSNFIRTYRLAFTPTGEYSQHFGSTGATSCNKTAVLNSLATGLNMLNPIYKRDIGVQFTLVTTEALVFCDPVSDPFDVYNPNQSIPQNQIEIDNIIGNTNYDVGHLLVWQNLGGAALLGVVCANSHKANGFSGSDASTTSLFVDYVAHEMGHQFNADHNFVSNECITSADNLRYEPGEGSSIMSYAGVCNAGYQFESDPFFHSASIDAMSNFIGALGSTCGSTSITGNTNAPIANALSDITIPKETPYVLVASATDINDPIGALTYVWEQYDGSSAAVNGSPNCNSTTAPLVKYIDPTTDHTRVIPEMTQVLTGVNNGAAWEQLSCVSRTMNFRVVVRDNHFDLGRTDTDAMAVNVNANAGPFLVNYPNGGQSLSANSTQTITWAVNNTNTVNSRVDILFTEDGGITSTILAMDVSNDGVQNVTMPNLATSTGRIIIQGSIRDVFKSASTFFDISDADFALTLTLPLDLLSFAGLSTSTGNELTWTTANELNTKSFEIEKSIDGVTFQTIGNKGSKGDNTNDIHSYKFIDRQLSNPTTYYRLKQIDNDGIFQYSNIISIFRSPGSATFNISPNPVNQILNIYGIDDTAPITLMITDSKGKQIAIKKVNSLQNIDVSSLASGIYFLTLDTQGSRMTQRFVKL